MEALQVLSATPRATHEMSTLLSALNQPRHAHHAYVRAIVDCLLDQGLPQAVAAFNRHFGRGAVLPLRLYLANAVHGTAEVRPALPLTLAVALWQVLLSPKTVRGIRRCPTCGRYFFDRSRRGVRPRCSRRCAFRVASPERAERPKNATCTLMPREVVPAYPREGAESLTRDAGSQ